MTVIVDLEFAEQYRRHASRCFHIVGTGNVIDGCLPDGPPLAGCATGESLHRLATRQQEPFAQTALLREMLAPPHPRASYR